MLTSGFMMAKSITTDVQSFVALVQFKMLGMEYML